MGVSSSGIARRWALRGYEPYRAVDFKRVTVNVQPEDIVLVRWLRGECSRILSCIF